MTGLVINLDACHAMREAILVSKLKIAKQLINLSPGSGAGWIIDGGCHIGRFSGNAVKEFPASRVLAFEPDPDSWACAQKNLCSHRQVEIVKAALGAEKKQAEFFRGPIPVTNSLLPRPSEGMKPYYPEQAYLKGGCLVDVVTLDEECEKRGITDIDLFKLDLQGGELLALDGVNKLLGSNAIKVIITEAVFVRKYQDQPLLWELWQRLETYGYSLFSLMDIKVGLYHPEEPGLRQMQWNQCDAIFISSPIRAAMDKSQ
jgi:FkbM family methyltransferase